MNMALAKSKHGINDVPGLDEREDLSEGSGMSNASKVGVTEGRRMCPVTCQMPQTRGLQNIMQCQEDYVKEHVCIPNFQDVTEFVT
ncbi:hypothetical protein NDU88_006269 [Pleurodeles waltl]|uniref:Uncharacterized protein n=1 Tax=Pleurodeles waltl TaxID=8319 RepID=A0AAV7N0D1_PLEWA|nr:hypothetical protein NDU88_006269 [Pleurodeles waltl]